MRSCKKWIQIIMLLAGALCAADNAMADSNAWPCAGRPAITVVGGTFSVGDMKEGAAYLSGGGARIPLTVSDGDNALYPGAGVGQLPEDLPPGRYDLIVPVKGGEGVRPGAVHVLAAYPETYTVALLRADGGEDPSAELFSKSLLSRAAAESAALVFAVGQLTRDGESASYQSLLTGFAEVGAPVVLCPDQAELDRGGYTEHFGNPEHAFQFGKDGYLVLGPGLSHGNAGTASRIGPMYRWRRALRASRWSVGIAGRYGLDWSMRSQLTLFVDDPLDYLIAGEAPPGLGEKIPWGMTLFAVPTSAPVEPLQVIEVDGSKMAVRIPVIAPDPDGETAPAAE